jgi:hypothetical protein
MIVKKRTPLPISGWLLKWSAAKVLAFLHMPWLAI